MRTWIGALAAATVVAACATPNAKHVAYVQGTPRASIGDAYDSYLLPKSIITVDQGSVDGKDVYAISLKLAGDMKTAFGIRAVDRFGVNTEIAVTKLDNTQLLQSVSVEIDDKRIEYIGSAFKLLGTLALAATGAPSASMGGANTKKFPVDADTQERLVSASCGREKCTASLFPRGATTFAANLLVDEVPPDAIDLAIVLQDLDHAKGAIFAPACRRAEVRIPTQESNKEQVFGFSLADPRYVQIIPLPSKGTITFHSECGFSVVSEKVEIQSNAAVAESFLKKLQALLESLKDKKDKDENKDESE